MAEIKIIGMSTPKKNIVPPSGATFTRSPKTNEIPSSANPSKTLNPSASHATTVSPTVVDKNMKAKISCKPSSISMLIQCEKARFRSELAIQANTNVTKIPTIPITIDMKITPFVFWYFFILHKKVKYFIY